MINAIPITIVDRTLYERIRLIMVRAKLLPDITKYPDAESYENAKSVLENVVEVIGDGTAEQRGTKKLDCITVTRKTTEIGSIGAHGLTQYGKNGDGTFTKEGVPATTHNVVYDIRISVSTKQLEAYVTDNLYTYLGTHQYLLIPTELKGFTRAQGVLMTMVDDITLETTNYREKLLKYRANDIWLGYNPVLNPKVPVLNTIKFGIGILNGLEEKTEKVFETEVKN